MGEPSGAELVRAGREALAAADWDRARERFERAGDHGQTAEMLDGLSDLAHFTGDYPLAIELKERAFAEFRDAGESVRAATCARWLGFLHGTYHGNFTVAGAWIGRAAAVLDGVDECAEHGWLVLDRAPFSDDLTEREQVAAAALAIARRYGDVALEFDAIALLGETLVASGRVAEGMLLVDEAMAAVAGGEIGDHGVVGEIYCRLLSACEHALDLRRAQEWMAAIDRTVVWTHFVRPTCRTHYGGILVALGRWAEAEAELLDAIAAFERGYRGDRVFPLLRLADLRVQQGRYEEAERLLDGLEWHPRARRAAALIARARGDLGLAAEQARLCLEGADESDPACALLLELLVAIAVSQGDLEGARASLERLTAVAEATGSRRAAALAALGTGRVRAAEHEDGASAHLKDALERFSELALPLEAARARLELARAVADGSPDVAVSEARLALAAFEELGAAADADVTAALLRELGTRGGRSWPRRQGQLTKRELEVLALLRSGLSNAEIAERLVISRRTAEHHVASILAKLALRSRAEAAAYATRELAEDR